MHPSSSILPSFISSNIGSGAVGTLEVVLAALSAQNALSGPLSRLHQQQQMQLQQAFQQQQFNCPVPATAAILQQQVRVGASYAILLT